MNFVEVCYTRDDLFPTSDKTNVVIAAFNTAHAWLQLYSVPERLQTRVLYFDTDFVIFTSQPNEWMPALGDWLDDDDHITSFVSGWGGELFLSNQER